MARSFRLTLEYDGAEFEGWQTQRPGTRTVQQTLEAAIRRVTSESVRVTGSGRTDSGVHAQGQVASVRLESALAPERLRHALNGVLPPDLAVLELEVAAEGFDARRDATGKLYRYAIWNGALRSPLRRSRSFWLRRPLDLEALRRASVDLIGSHDFSSFKAAGSAVKTDVRTLRRLDVCGKPGSEIVLDFEGNGFLRHMVRNLVGTLVEVGSGRRDPAGMPALLAARNRSLAGPTAPAHGLSLVRVHYARTEPDSEENTGA